MTAEIIPLARWRRCRCQYCRAVAEAWNQTGPAQTTLESFLADNEHLLWPRDNPFAALGIIAERGSRLSRGLAKHILERAWLLRTFRDRPGDGDPPDAA
jgi:hypothetical protein